MSFWNAIGKEKHLLTYPDTPHGPVGFIYPNEYSIGMACLGYQQVYRLFRNAGFSVERVFFDKKGRETRSVENQTPLFRFPIIAASFIYELDIVNLIQMLLQGGVDPLSENRDSHAPLVILGGTAASGNPALLSRIADAVVLGEGEDTIDQIAAIIAANPDQPKDDMLLQLSKIPHVYVPKIHGAYSPLQFSGHQLEPIDSLPCHSVILAEEDEFGGAFLLELSRGCDYSCKFCVVHHRSGNARYRQFDSLISILEEYQEQFVKVGLLSAAVADHPQVTDIVEWLVSRDKQVSTSSLRAERLSGHLLDLLKQGGQQTLTIAPEAGSLDIRKTMLKGVQDEKYFALAEEAGKRRFQQIKLYFLLGTPGADPASEATEIIRFSSQFNEIFTKNGGGKLVLTCSPLVPKPLTPWGEAPLWDAKEVKKASRTIRKKLAFQGNMKVPPVNVKEARLEAILSWADASVTDELIRLVKTGEPIENAFENTDFAALHNK